MDPTPEELARAAELAPHLNERIGAHEVVSSGTIMVNDLDSPLNARCVTPLDPRAFQAVLLALPRGVVSDMMIVLTTEWQNLGRPRDFWVWLLTPAGMVAFYEALVAQPKP